MRYLFTHPFIEVKQEESQFSGESFYWWWYEFKASHQI